MSVLDQAFIRAYGKDEPVSATEQGSPVPPPMPTGVNREITHVCPDDITANVGDVMINDAVPRDTDATDAGVGNAVLRDAEVSAHWYGDAKWYRSDQPENLDPASQHPPAQNIPDDGRVVSPLAESVDAGAAPAEQGGRAKPDIGAESGVQKGVGSTRASNGVKGNVSAGQHGASNMGAEEAGAFDFTTARPQVLVDTSTLDDLLKPEPTEPIDSESSSDLPDEQHESAWVFPPIMEQDDGAAQHRPMDTSLPPMRVDAGGGSVPTPHLIVEPPRPAQRDAADGSTAGTSTGNAPQIVVTVPDADTERQSGFNPAWEVDRLRWPALCERLTADHGDRIKLISEKLLKQYSVDSSMIAVTSCQSGEGCTTISLCLARTMAAEGARILLVDGNFRSPGIASSLGLDAPHGWNDAIADRCPLREAAILSLDDKLTVLPLKPNQYDPLACWSSPRAGQLLRFATNLFDLILVDCGPLENRHSTLHLTDNFSLPERALLVRDVRNTLLDDVHQVVRRLQTVGIDTIGIAENFGETTPEWSLS